MTSEANPEHAIPVRTAVRFPLHLDVALSTAQGDVHGVTENVSANGILLLTTDAVPVVGTEVSFRLLMPAAVMGGSEDVTLHCVGRVVRSDEREGQSSAAVVIDEYSLRAEP